MGDKGKDTWQVIGAYRVIYGSGFLVEPVYAPITSVSSVNGVEDTASQLLIQGHVSTLAEENALSDRMKARMEAAGIRLDFYTTSARLDQRVYAYNQFASVISTLISLTMLVASVVWLGRCGSALSSGSVRLACCGQSGRARPPSREC